MYGRNIIFYNIISQPIVQNRMANSRTRKKRIMVGGQYEQQVLKLISDATGIATYDNMILRGTPSDFDILIKRLDDSYRQVIIDAARLQQQAIPRGATPANVQARAERERILEQFHIYEATRVKLIELMRLSDARVKKEHEQHNQREREQRPAINRAAERAVPLVVENLDRREELVNQTIAFLTRYIDNRVIELNARVIGASLVAGTPVHTRIDRFIHGEIELFGKYLRERYFVPALAQDGPPILPSTTRLPNNSVIPTNLAERILEAEMPRFLEKLERNIAGMIPEDLRDITARANEVNTIKGLSEATDAMREYNALQIEPVTRAGFDQQFRDKCVIAITPLQANLTALRDILISEGSTVQEFTRRFNERFQELRTIVNQRIFEILVEILTDYVRLKWSFTSRDVPALSPATIQAWIDQYLPAERVAAFRQRIAQDDIDCDLRFTLLIGAQITPTPGLADRYAALLQPIAGIVAEKIRRYSVSKGMFMLDWQQLRHALDSPVPDDVRVVIEQIRARDQQMAQEQDQIIAVFRQHIHDTFEPQIAAAEQGKQDMEIFNTLRDEIDAAFAEGYMGHVERMQQNANVNRNVNHNVNNGAHANNGAHVNNAHVNNAQMAQVMELMERNNIGMNEARRRLGIQQAAPAVQANPAARVAPAANGRRNEQIAELMAQGIEYNEAVQIVNVNNNVQDNHRNGVGAVANNNRNRVAAVAAHRNNVVNARVNVEAAPAVVAARRELVVVQQQLQQVDAELQAIREAQAEFVRWQENPADRLNIDTIPALNGHVPFLRLTQNEKECVPFDAIIVNNTFQYVPHDIFARIRRERAQAANYNVRYQARNDFDRNMIIQERLRREIFQGKYEAMNALAPANRSEIQNYMIDHHPEIESEYAAQNSTRNVRSTYPMMDTDGKECHNCGDDSSDVITVYRLHYHTITENDKEQLRLLDEELIQAQAQFEAREQAREQAVAQGQDPIEPQGQGRIRGLEQKILAINTEHTVVEDAEDYWCATCYFDIFMNKLLPEQGLGENISSCPLSTCKFPLTPYQLWRMYSRLTPEQERYNKRKYVNDYITKIRDDNRVIQLAGLRNISNTAALEPYIQPFLTIMDVRENLRREISAQRAEQRRREVPERPIIRNANGEIEPPPREIVLAERAFDEETQTQLRAAPKLNILTMKGAEIEALLDALPTLCERLQNVLAKRRAMNSNKEILEITAQLRDSINGVNARSVALREQVTAKEVLVEDARGAARAAAENNRLEQEYQRQMAEYNIMIGRRINEARTLRMRYDSTVSRFNHQKRNHFSNHLDSSPQNHSVFCPYCCAFVGMRKNDRAIGFVVACRFFYFSSDAAHVHNENGRQFVRYGFRSDNRTECQDICTVCNGPTCNHDHTPLTNPDSVGNIYADFEPCFTDDNRRPGQQLDRVCISEGGGGIIESVARLLAYRDYAIETIREDPQNFTLEFPAMLQQATLYAIQIRGYIKSQHHNPRILEPAVNSAAARALYERCVVAERNDRWDNPNILLAALGPEPPIVPTRAQLEIEYPPPRPPAGMANGAANAAAPAVSLPYYKRIIKYVGSWFPAWRGGKHHRRSVTKRSRPAKLRKRFAVSKRKRRVGKN